MLQFRHTMGAGVENLRFIGNSNEKPSCAILFVEENGAGLSFFNHLARVWIGNVYGYDEDDANQFVSGIVATGTMNGDSNTMSHIRITGCDAYGVDIQNHNWSNTHFNGLFIQNCSVGMRTIAGSIIGTNWLFNSCGVDLQQENGSNIFIHGFASEGSGRMLVVNDASTRIHVVGGSWQVGTSGGSSTINPDGKFIQTGGSGGDWVIILENFALQQDVGTLVPTIEAHNVRGGVTLGTLVLRQVKGIDPINIDVGSLVWTNDFRNVVYEPIGVGPMPRAVMLGNHGIAGDESFQPWRQDVGGKFNIFGGDLAVRCLPVPEGVIAMVAEGGGDRIYSYRVSALTYSGETTASEAVVCRNAETLTPHATNRVEWHPVAGAQSYRVYGRVADAELLLKTLTWNEIHPGTVGSLSSIFWIDDGSVTPDDCR